MKCTPGTVQPDEKNWRTRLEDPIDNIFSFLQKISSVQRTHYRIWHRKLSESASSSSI